MSDQIVFYLTLISKLTDILCYYKKHSEPDKLDSHDLTSYIQECKSIYINKVKSDPLIKVFLQEISQGFKQEEVEEEIEQNTEHKIGQDIEQVLQEFQKEDIEQLQEQDIELKDQLDTLASLLTVSIQSNKDEPISSETFDTLGSGLSKMFRISDNNPTPTRIDISQLKNEINNTNSNINFEIKRKQK